MKGQILNTIMPQMDRSKSKMELKSYLNNTRDDFLNPTF